MELNNIYNMDCLEGMKLLADNSVDAIVTDPPYWLSFMGKKRDYDVPSQEIREEALRVLKPWWYLLSFAGTRTQHRMAVRIEDAWFEIRDMIAWVYWCLSEDTEILTKDGWKDYSKITWYCPVYCYNVDKDIFEYHLPTNYFLYENKYPAYRIQSGDTDQIVSRNHRVAVEQDWRIIFKYAETLKQQENIPILESVSEMWETIWNEHKRTSYKEQILLWLCMKSYIREKEMNIEGNKLYVWENLWDMLNTIYDKEKKTLKVLLEQMQLNSEMTGISEALTQVKELMDWTIKNIIQSKNVMTELQVLEELRNSYKEEMKVCKSNDKICEMSYWVYWNEQEWLICDGTQTCCCNWNMKTTNKDWVCPSCKSQCRGQQHWESDVVQNELRTQELWALKRYTTTLATITEIEYDWYVWCVKVPTWCFVARRNWKIFITGNSGFPKSLNIGKAVDKLQGNEREQFERTDGAGNKQDYLESDRTKSEAGVFGGDKQVFMDSKGTSEWEGWGTALKPALEPITVARKPLWEKTVAENCLKWGTGGINIDWCRVEMPDREEYEAKQRTFKSATGKVGELSWKNSSPLNDPETSIENSKLGRFPANFIHDWSNEVVDLFPNDNARFFYCAKASKSERNKGCENIPIKDPDYRTDTGKGSYVDKWIAPQSNSHPTVKPIALMEYLVKLVSREDAVVLDPFTWSWSTLIACKKLKRQYIWFELDEDYITIAEARLQSIKSEDTLL